MTYEQFKERYNITLNKQQEEAVCTVDGPVLLLAVPGSGKTTVLVSRLGYMIYGKGIRPQQILTVTYTVAATRDMKERFISMFGEEYARQLEFRTINGISQKILQYFAECNHTTVYDVADKEAAELIKQTFHEVTGNFATESDLKDLQTGITYAKNMRLDLNEIQKMEEKIPNFREIFQKYNKELKKRHMIDYDDQIVYALRILEQYPQVLRYFQQKYTYICVDEAQDTSKIQHDMIALLASSANNLFMVGDEDQSIYGFRAAYPQVLSSFEKTHPGAAVLFMELNYRSGSEIVEAADRFIQKNKNRHKKNVRPTREEKGSVRKIPVKNRGNQYYYLAKVAEECDKETAVLYRNHESALPLIDILERRGIPYRIRNHDTTFFSHPVVRDICDFISLAQNPWDGEIFLKIYYKMGAGISKAQAMYAIDHHVGQGALLETLLEEADVSSYTRRQGKALLTHFQNLVHENAGKAIYRIIHFMGYGEYMDDRGMDSGKADILKMLGDQEENLSEFQNRLIQLQQIMSEGTMHRDGNLILSTIHASKGLEYDRVYLADMIDGVLPGVNQTKEPAAYEEERRLFYVGMTRAKNELYVFSFQNGENSPFVTELFSKKKVTSNPATELKAGMRIRHLKFGKGIVQKCEGNTARVEFADGSVRNLAMSVVLGNHMITVEKE
ncbi:ATP-dependent helicase [Roseburia sp. MUC/MUC-530-WT-4D]|uniref:DNA 3'-5' helicase n=1 Tax=Roseburia porci TaxID=2605790 RepID=A0A6L5YVW8_9FIRM|nr:ATP-dependent helicase [Roseburia porci]MCI5517301.1 ATP-dependent helicase [Roseburia sp.]MDD6742563.1 ATP-dependent helicase [Roseburia porci]MST76082.1 ATP-dependent helicase [Roseburia porci]